MMFLILQEYWMAELFSQQRYMHIIDVVLLTQIFLLRNVAIRVRAWDMRLPLL